ncbi:Zinc finger, RING/FYVE/PHD-type [Plasmopara halstedii]|uniref:Zinc finger, RING/FYVE/PHD-type n=1 Tax=Plasmopara halstedii TaxID=4781 RepID=A0A0P1ANQ9_PLAHL|nr:Zinc finger, RING/FYVE/PHD-type [Plasmopara halstedii]CEG43074.1 Zinc finger, RING/FYVE/PHD-type [Plasmopara halstedii]|eukprot:XP_024579443.1 Zinc finger, RING/FYVE/PHD-type [Plasmopara halstedii]
MGRARSLSRRRAQSGASGTSRNEYWQPPPLTTSERAYMIRKAKEASVALVDHAHTLDGPVQWHYTGKFRGIQMYRGEGSYDNMGATGTEYLCGVTTMIGSIEEVAGYFDQQTTEDMVAKKAEDVLDCGVLYSLVYGDPKNLFYRVSAKYLLYEGPSAFSRDRDYCFLECQNTFRHASGRRGWVLSMHSIKLPSCPEVEGVVRGSMYQSGYVFVEAEKDGYMDVMHSLQINFKSSSRLPHFLLNSTLKQRISSVVTISRHIQTSRMGRQTLLRKEDLMPKRARALCANCSRKFSLFVRKTRCRVCGEVVCHPCAPQVLISTARGPAKTRVCTKCYNTSRGEEYEPEINSRRLQNNTRYSDILQDHDEHLNLYHGEDEGSMNEDGGEDGLEEQSDYSVFAQSRFTDASRDSMVPSHFNASKYHFDSQFDGSSQFDASSEMDESQYYDGGSSESSYISGVSGTSSSDWEGDSTTASKAAWHRAKPTYYNHDSQAFVPVGSDMYGSKNHRKENSASHADRRKQWYNAAPILEDEPSSHSGHDGRLEAHYGDYSSTQSTNYNSSQVSDFKASGSSYSGNEFKATKEFMSSQGSHSSSSQGSQYSNSSQGSKTVSIQSLAKAHSARYGVKSQFPPPPPPPLSSPMENGDENNFSSRLHTLGSEKSNSRNPKGITARKMFTPPPSRISRSSNRVSQKSQTKASSVAKTNRDSIGSYTSSQDSTRNNIRSSAILEQMRRNRVRTLQYTPDSERPSLVSECVEQDHHNRMREIEKIKEQATDKAIRRSMASHASSKRGVQSDRGSRAIQKDPQQTRLSTRRSRAVSRTSSVLPPGSPPGTPPSMRNRPLPLPNSLLNRQADRSSRENLSQSTAPSINIADRHVTSNPPDVTDSGDSKLGALISVAHSAQGDRLTSKSHSSSRQSRLSQASNVASTRNSKRLGASQGPSIPRSSHRGNLAFDLSQLSVNKFKFSSSTAILENPSESPHDITMMERPSLQSSLGDSLLDEEVLTHSSGLAEHIKSMRARARAANKLPDEENRELVELQMRQEEHRKRMDELSKLAANHDENDSERDSTSTYVGLHDSSISLTEYSNNEFGTRSNSFASSASSVDIDDEDFDFENRPPRRIKRSGTFPFALEEMEQRPGTKSDDDEQRESLNGSDASFCKREEVARTADLSCSSINDLEQEDEPDNMTIHPSEHDFVEVNASEVLSSRSDVTVIQEYNDKSHLPRQTNESDFYKDEVDTLAFRPSEKSAEDEDRPMDSLMNPSRHSTKELKEMSQHFESDKYVCHTGNFANNTTTPSRRLSKDEQDEYAEVSRNSSKSSLDHEYEGIPRDASPRSSELSTNSTLERKSGYDSPPRRQSSEFAEPESSYLVFADQSSVESASDFIGEKLDHHFGPISSNSSNEGHRNGYKTPRRQSMESRGSGLSTPPRRSSVRTSSGCESEDHLEIEPERNSYLSVDQTSGLTTPPHRQSEQALGYDYEIEYRKSDQRLSETSNEHGPIRRLTLSRRSSKDYRNSQRLRLSEKSLEQNEARRSSAHESIQSVYRSSEESLKHESECESVSSSDLEPEDADSMIRASEQQADHETSGSKFQLLTSKLIPDGGDSGVEAISRKSYNSFLKSKQLAQVNELEEDTRSPRDTSDLHESFGKDQTKSLVFKSSEISERLASSRDSNVSSLDEELMNRPTIELFDIIHANRPSNSANKQDPSDTMHKLEASHLRRMEELNRIALDQLGDRLSNFNESMLGSAFQPGRSMYPGYRTEGDEIQWRSSSIMQEVQSKHQVDMEKLRRRIRQLEEECRESIASVLTPEEMDLSELDSDDDDVRPYGGRRSFNPQSSFMCASDLSASTISEHASDDGSEHHQPLPARILFERIAQLTQLQRAMAEAEGDSDDEKHHDRIKEQYRMLRSIKASSARQERESLSSEPLSEENWI